MKRWNVLIVLLFSVLSLMAQDRLSVFIGNTNRYASVDLVGFRKRLCRDYRMSPRDLDDYYRMCGRNWGNVGLALEIAHSSGRHMRDVCKYYKKYGGRGWNRVLVEIGIRPGSHCYNPFYDRLDYYDECWHDSYDSYHRHHKHYHHKHKKYYKYDDDDDDDDDD